MNKNIYENFDWDLYYNLLDSAIEDGVHIVHENHSFLNGKFTFVWQRTSTFAKAKMIKVAISFCSDKDTFVRKIGAFNALHNFYEKQQVILLPVGDEDSATIVNRLRQIFYETLY